MVIVKQRAHDWIHDNKKTWGKGNKKVAKKIYFLEKSVKKRNVFTEIQE